MIILLHGFGSNGEDSRTNNIIKEWFPDEVVLTPSYRYHNPDSSYMDLREFVTHAQDQYPDEHELIFIGISLGGFWARYLAADFSADKLIMLNPALEPFETLKPRIGKSVDGYSGNTYTMTENNVKNYATYSVETDCVELPITVLVADDDDVVPPNMADKHIGAMRAHIIHTTGGHRFENTLESHRGDIEFAVYSVNGGLYCD